MKLKWFKLTELVEIIAAIPLDCETLHHHIASTTPKHTLALTITHENNQEQEQWFHWEHTI